MHVRNLLGKFCPNPKEKHLSTFYQIPASGAMPFIRQQRAAEAIKCTRTLAAQEQWVHGIICWMHQYIACNDPGDIRGHLESMETASWNTEHFSLYFQGSAENTKALLSIQNMGIYSLLTSEKVMVKSMCAYTHTHKKNTHGGLHGRVFPQFARG